MKVCIALLLLAVSACVSADELTPTLELSAVRVEVTWVANSAELAEIRKRFETPLQRSRSSSGIGDIYRRGDVADGVNGFSVLGRRNGEFVCLLFIQKPRRVNDDRTTIIGHELLHCLLGEYH